MIRKQVFTINDDTSEKEFDELLKNITNSKNKLKVLRISSELATKHIKIINNSKINYLILRLTDETKTFAEEINQFKLTNKILVPEIKVSQKNKLLKEIEQIKGIKQLILNYSNQKELKNQEELFAELYAQRIYPLTKNIPFCNSSIENCYELFFQETIPEEIRKSKICENCKLNKYCKLSIKEFKPKKMFIDDVDKNIIRFLEDLE